MCTIGIGSPKAGNTRQSNVRFEDPKSHAPGRDPSERIMGMDCPRSVRTPLGQHRSNLSKMKNTDEPEAENKGQARKVEVCGLVIRLSVVAKS